MMTLLFKSLISIPLALLMFTDVIGDMEQEVYLGLKEGNAKKIAAYFADNVSVTIKNSTGYYSKFQSEMVLKEFLRTYRATEVKQIQDGSTQGKQNFKTYEFMTSSRTFRVFVRFISEDERLRITELRIE